MINLDITFIIIVHTNAIIKHPYQNLSTGLTEYHHTVLQA